MFRLLKHFPDNQITVILEVHKTTATKFQQKSKLINPNQQFAGIGIVIPYFLPSSKLLHNLDTKVFSCTFTKYEVISLN